MFNVRLQVGEGGVQPAEGHMCQMTFSAAPVGCIKRKKSTEKKWDTRGGEERKK